MSVTWDGGARSIETLRGNGGFRVQIEAGITGVVVGFRQGPYSPEPYTITHGFRISTGRYQVTVNATSVTAWRYFSETTWFTVRRIGGVTEFYVGDGTEEEPYGELIHTVEDALVGELYMTATFAQPLDRILDIERFEEPDLGSAEILVPVPTPTGEQGLSRGGNLQVPVPTITGSQFAGSMSAYAKPPTVHAAGQQWPLPVPAPTASLRTSQYKIDLQVPPPEVRASQGPTLEITTPVPEIRAAQWDGYIPLVGVNAIVPAPELEAWSYRITNRGVAAEAPAPNLLAMGEFEPVLRAEVPRPAVLYAQGENVGGAPYIWGLLPSLESPRQRQTDFVRDANRITDRVVREFAPYDVAGTHARIADRARDNAGDRVREHVHIAARIRQVTGDRLVAAVQLRDVVDDWSVDYLQVHARIAERVSGAQSRDDRVHDHSRIRSRYRDAVSDVLVSASTLQDSFTDISRDRVTEAATIRDRVHGNATTEDRVLAHSRIRDRVADLVVWSDSVHEHATISDRVRDMFGAAWVMNLESGAAWRYESYRVRAVAGVGDATFGVGPEGLLLLGGDVDAGSAIAAAVEWGVLALGPSDRAGLPTQDIRKKIVHDMWVGSAGGDPLLLEVQVTDLDNKWYPYTIPPMVRAAPQSQRAKLGVGLRGCYWRTRIRNIDGGQLNLIDLEATVSDLTRKR